GERGLTRAQRSRRSANRALVEAGLTEAASHPFLAVSTFARLRYDAADERRTAGRLPNPLADAEPLLRTEPLQPLLPTARRNLGRGEEAVAIFQYATAAIVRVQDARSPLPSAAQRPSEEELVALDSSLPAQTRALAAV